MPWNVDDYRTKFRLACGRKIVYIPQKAPKGTDILNPPSAGLGVRDECCRCDCPCSTECTNENQDGFIDSFGGDEGALDNPPWVSSGWWKDGNSFAHMYVLPGAGVASMEAGSGHTEIVLWMIGYFDEFDESTPPASSQTVQMRIEGKVNGKPLIAFFQLSVSSSGIHYAVSVSVDGVGFSKSGNWDAHPSFNMRLRLFGDPEKESTAMGICATESGTMIADNKGIAGVKEDKSDDLEFTEITFHMDGEVLTETTKDIFVDEYGYCFPRKGCIEEDMIWIDYFDEIADYYPSTTQQIYKGLNYPYYSDDSQRFTENLTAPTFTIETGDAITEGSSGIAYVLNKKTTGPEKTACVRGTCVQNTENDTFSLSLTQASESFSITGVWKYVSSVWEGELSVTTASGTITQIPVELDDVPNGATFDVSLIEIGLLASAGLVVTYPSGITQNLGTYNIPETSPGVIAAGMGCSNSLGSSTSGFSAFKTTLDVEYLMPAIPWDGDKTTIEDPAWIDDFNDAAGPVGEPYFVPEPDLVRYTGGGGIEGKNISTLPSPNPANVSANLYSPNTALSKRPISFYALNSFTYVKALDDLGQYVQFSIDAPGGTGIEVLSVVQYEYRLSGSDQILITDTRGLVHSIARTNNSYITAIRTSVVDSVDYVAAADYCPLKLEVLIDGFGYRYSDTTQLAESAGVRIPSIIFQGTIAYENVAPDYGSVVSWDYLYCTDPNGVFPAATFKSNRAPNVLPGTAVAQLFTKYKCDGRSYVHTMNNNGLQWSLQNLDLICSWIERTAKLKHLPYDSNKVRQELIEILESLN